VHLKLLDVVYIHRSPYAFGLELGKILAITYAGDTPLDQNKQLYSPRCMHIDALTTQVTNQILTSALVIDSISLSMLAEGQPLANGIDILVVFNSSENLSRPCLAFQLNGYVRWHQLECRCVNLVNSLNPASSSAEIRVYKKNIYIKTQQEKYIVGCESDNVLDEYRIVPFGNRPFQIQLESILQSISDAVTHRTPLSFLRIGDGDVYFANALPVGSASPGKRALTLNYCQKDNLDSCRKSLWLNDFICVEKWPANNGAIRLMILLEPFYRLLEFIGIKVHIRNRAVVSIISQFLWFTSRALAGKSISRLLSPVTTLIASLLHFKNTINTGAGDQTYNFEVLYALVASRAIFRSFPNSIMLVGQSEKLAVIEELVKRSEYRHYLGIEDFCGYVPVPKIGAADNESQILRLIQAECQNCKPEIILLGIGSSKLYIAPRIREFSDACVIDVGAGIDALAGVISQDRPFFANWINFTIAGYDYSSMDLMDSGNPKRFSSLYGKSELS